MKVELISWTKDPIKTIARACSQCYDSKPSVKVVKHCINSGHLSVLESANFTFEIKEVSRVLLAQLTRHRTGSYSVRSQRFCKEDGFKYYIPNSVKNSHAATVDYNTIMKKCQEYYEKLLVLGVPAEDARYVLPNACYTNLVMTFDLRNLAHFMNERLCTRAQKEIRELANMMREAIKNKQEEMGLTSEEMEIIQELLVPKCESGVIKFCPEVKSCGRHRTAKEINEMLK